MSRILLLLLLLPQIALSVTLDERRQKILKIIDLELSEVQRISSQKRGRDPDLLLRMAELNLEKARLWRDKENKEFLSIPTRKRARLNKASFFKESSKYFFKANQLCLSIVRRFKRYGAIGDVYYILGFNAKEANKLKLAGKYLSLPNRKSKRSTKTKVKSQISLAEVYYNQKQYKRAIPLYERALRTYKDKWYTKDSFNLAWCYYRVGKARTAITKMREVYSVSKNKKFIDMRDDVERDIGLFYATSGRINEGINFYKDLNLNFTDKLLRIGSDLVAQGKFTEADKVFGYAQSYEKNNKKKIDIYLEQLNLFGKYARYQKHLNASRKIYAIHVKDSLTKEQMTSYEFQLKKMSAILQRQVVGKTYRRLVKVRRQKANQAIAYFDILSKLKKDKKAEYLFLKAETAYAAGLTSSAFNYYKSSFEQSIKGDDKRFKKQSMEGLLAILASKRGRSANDNIYVFEQYLKNFPADKRTKSIYERLFKNYLDGGNYNKAKETLDRYVQFAPNDFKLQEVMISNLMEIDRKKKDNAAIRAWVTQIDNKKYRVSKKYYLKLQELLTSLQIKDVQRKLDKGDKKSALVGYHKVLSDPYATKRSKINATYNLAALYYELGDINKAYLWSGKSLAQMSSKDVDNFSSSFITIANFMFTQLEYKKSSELYKNYLIKVCSRRSSKKSLVFKNLFFIQLATHDTAGAESTLTLGTKCRVRRSVLANARFELMKEYKSQKSWSRYEKYASSLSNSNTYYSKVIDDMIFLENLFIKYNNNTKANRYRSLKEKLFYKAKRAKRSLSLTSLNHFADKKLLDMKRIANRLKLISLEFPENVFNQRLKSKLALLEDLTQQAQNVHSVGSGKGIIQSYKILYEEHLKFANELGGFSPTGKGDDYVVSFKKSMNDLVGNIRNAGNNYKVEAIRTLKKNKVLDKSNFIFLDDSKTGMPAEYHGLKTPYLMERGGRR